MTKSATIKKLTLAEVKAKIAKGQSKSRADPATADDLPAAFWADAVHTQRRPAKQSVHLRVDAEVLAWFKSQGAGHLTLMNEVLKTYSAAKGRKAE